MLFSIIYTLHQKFEKEICLRTLKDFYDKINYLLTYSTEYSIIKLEIPPNFKIKINNSKILIESSCGILKKEFKFYKVIPSNLTLIGFSHIFLAKINNNILFITNDTILNKVYECISQGKIYCPDGRCAEECCTKEDCKISCIGGEVRCESGRCVCKCPKDYYWNGTHCIYAPWKKYCNPNIPLPSKWDWRNVNGKNYITPIKDQGTCGACWAFSTVAGVEAYYNIYVMSINPDFSEQQLISDRNPCCGNCGDCNGGWPHLALRYIESMGIVDENCYPYKCSNYGINRGPYECDLCKDWKRRAFKIKGFGRVKPTIEDVKRALICYGPLVVVSRNWMHAILLVGYDDNNNICKRAYGKKGCWIIKNSWGAFTGWAYGVYHENGYGYIPYEGHPYSDLINYAFYIIT